ncbi:MAG: hypothetical protein AB8I08_09785 [Sandaracinaceae bacterium]
MPSSPWLRAALPLAFLFLLACGDPECGAGAESCDGACVDVRLDPAHCGGCGVACEDGLVCSDGA